MITDVKFPYHGGYETKSGKEWDFWLNEDGAITCVERSFYDERGHWHLQTGRITSGLLNYIEELLGKRTDGWRWQTAEDIQKEEELSKRIPIDGTYKNMRKSEFEVHEYRRNRRVYRHVLTGDLYYMMDGVWYRTYEEYCYNNKTHELGKYWRR